METVHGIGGFFFRAVDPAGLSRWHADHLGVLPVPTSYDDPVWQQQAGPTVFAPFGSEQGESPTPGGRAGVLDPDAMVAQLRDAGIVVDVSAEEYPNGRFAQVTDPEGNAVRLWSQRIPLPP